MRVIMGMLGVLVIAAAGGCDRAPGGGPGEAVQASPVNQTTPVPRGCAWSALPLPAGSVGADIGGVDPEGHHVAAVPLNKGGNTPAVLWTDGEPRPLTEDWSFTPAGVNAAGAVAGTRVVDRQYQAVVIHDGKLTALARPGQATNWRAAGINGRGDVVGTADLPAAGSRVVLWPAGGAPVQLEVGGQQSRAVAVGEDGAVVADVGQRGFGRAYRWVPGAPATPLPLPEGYLSAEVVSVAGNWAIGNVRPGQVERDGRLVDDPGYPYAVVRWNLRTGEHTLMPKLVSWPAVGASGVAAGELDGSGHVAVWRDGGIFALPVPYPDPAPSRVFWVGPDGRTMVGTSRHDQLGATLAVWRGC